MAENRELTSVEKSEQLIEQHVANCNEQLKGNKLDAYNEAKAALDAEILNFNKIAEKAVYEKILCEPKPIVELAKRFVFDGKKPVEEKNDDKTKILAVRADDAKRRLNLAKFIKNYCTAEERTILSDIDKLYELLVIREKNVLSMSPVELKEAYAKNSSFFAETVKALQKGETPTSNSQIAKKLQEIVNKCGVEKRVTNVDIHQLQQWTFNKASGAGQSKAVTVGKFESFIVDVLNHHITGDPYELVVKKVG